MVGVGGVGVIIVCCGCGDHMTNGNTSENIRSNGRSKLT